MKRLISKLLFFTFVISAIPFTVGCEKNEPESQNLRFYFSSEDYTILYDVIERYNKYCENNNKDSYKIEAVEFDSADEMYTKMSTEIMAGGGPDILSLDYKLPFEKLINSKALADVNQMIANDKSDKKLDLSEFNSVIMEAGQFNGKQYIIPFFFGIDAMKTSDDLLNKFGIPAKSGTSITYEEIPVIFEKYFNNPKGCTFMWDDGFDFLDSDMQLFYKFICSYIDFKNKTTDFDTEEFRNNLDSMCKILNTFNMYSKQELFDDLYMNFSFSSMIGRYITLKEEGKNAVVLKGFTRNKEDCSAYIQMGVAVNENSKLKDKALEFIKYALSEDEQEYQCGDKENSDYSGSGNISHPVRNEAFNNSIYTASQRTDDNNNIMGIDNDYMASYIDMTKNISKCTLYLDMKNSYYSSEVIGDIVDSYLNGEISKDKFIRRLTSATEIYINE